MFYIARNPSEKILKHDSVLCCILLFLQYVRKAEHSENRVSKEIVSTFSPCYNTSPRFTSMVIYYYMICWYNFSL